MTRRMPVSHEGKIYYEFSHLYERIFTGLLGPRIRATIQSLNIPPGAKVLEVGVGTGLSLAAYPRHAQITAIDLAPEMLAQAQHKVDQNGWDHVQLRLMDALDMDFPDEYFDFVMGFHIVSVVADPQRLVREMLRVTRNGGTLVIINHFRSEKKWLAPLVDLLDPLTRRIGWRTTLRFDQVVNGFPLHVTQRFKTSAHSLFTVLVATKEQAPGAGACAETPRVSSKPPWELQRPGKRPRRALARDVVQHWAAGLARRRARKPLFAKKSASRPRPVPNWPDDNAQGPA